MISKAYEFTKLLQLHCDPWHEKVQQYLKDNADDAHFQKQAKILLELWEIKERNNL